MPDDDSEEDESFAVYKREDFDSSDDDLSEDSNDVISTGDAKKGKGKVVITEISQPPVISDTNKLDYKRSKLFKGSVKIKKKTNVPTVNAAIIVKRHFSIPIPILPALSKKHVSQELIEFIWQEFLNYDTDESELILFHYIDDVIHSINETFHYQISVKNMKLTILEADDYIEFKEFIGKLSEYFADINPGLTSSAQPKLHSLPTCCAQAACHPSDLVPYDAINDETYGDESLCSDSISEFSKKLKEDNLKIFHVSRVDKMKEDNNFQMLVAFTKFMVENNGKLRNKHVLQIIEKIGIKYSHDKLPPCLSSALYENFLVPSFSVFVDIVDSIRVDGSDLNNDRYNPDDDGSGTFLPQWLHEQYLPAEVLMFKHYYTNSISSKQESEEKDERCQIEDDAVSRLKYGDEDHSQVGFNGGFNGSIQSQSIELSVVESDDAVISRYRNILKNMNADLSYEEVRLYFI